MKALHLLILMKPICLTSSTTFCNQKRMIAQRVDAMKKAAPKKAIWMTPVPLSARHKLTRIRR
jgi:hypothetical protein